MDLALQESHVLTIKQSILRHPAWFGAISGLWADKLLRNRDVPYLYLLRKGEGERDYYVSFVQSDFSVKHQPFTLTVSWEGWYFENGGGGGPYSFCVKESILEGGAVVGDESHNAANHCVENNPYSEQGER